MELNDTNRLAFAFGYLSSTVAAVVGGNETLDNLRIICTVATEIADGICTSTEAANLRRRELSAQGKVTG